MRMIAISSKHYIRTIWNKMRVICLYNVWKHLDYGPTLLDIIDSNDPVKFSRACNKIQFNMTLSEACFMIHLQSGKSLRM